MFTSSTIIGRRTRKAAKYNQADTQLTQEACQEALTKYNHEYGTNTWNLPKEEKFFIFYCYEPIQQLNKPRSAKKRRLVNVKDNPEVCTIKNQQRLAKAQEQGSCLRSSKNAKQAGSKLLITYSKWLGTHVRLKAGGRRLPKYPRQHCSHLCDNEACERIKHLRIESGKRNQRRKGCVGFLLCKHCSKLYCVCKCHSKYKCLKVRQIHHCGPKANDKWMDTYQQDIASSSDDASSE